MGALSLGAAGAACPLNVHRTSGANGTGASTGGDDGPQPGCAGRAGSLLWHAALDTAAGQVCVTSGFTPGRTGPAAGQEAEQCG